MHVMIPNVSNCCSIVPTTAEEDLVPVLTDPYTWVKKTWQEMLQMIKLKPMLRSLHLAAVVCFLATVSHFSHQIYLRYGKVNAGDLHSPSTTLLWSMRHILQFAAAVITFVSYVKVKKKETLYLTLLGFLVSFSDSGFQCGGASGLLNILYTTVSI